MSDPDKPSPDPATLAAAFGVAEDMAYGAVAPPLYLSSTYEFAGYDQPRLYDYGRGIGQSNLCGGNFFKPSPTRFNVVTSIRIGIRSAIDF